VFNWFHFEKPKKVELVGREKNETDEHWTDKQVPKQEKIQEVKVKNFQDLEKG
jgi:hypothetical protein